MIFIDGEEKASLLGTGTEDFFNTSWCPKTIFTHPYYGYARVNNDNGWLGRTHVYRFFISDPIYFEKSLKGTIEHGHNNNLTLDISVLLIGISLKLVFFLLPHLKLTELLRNLFGIRICTVGDMNGERIQEWIKIVGK